MRFEKVKGAPEMKSIWPPRDFQINGRQEFDPGLVVSFLGKPASCETEQYARERVRYEQTVNLDLRGNKQAQEDRFKEVDQIIIDHLKNHEDYLMGKIRLAPSDKERLIEKGQLVCEYCGDVDFYVAGNPKNLLEHQKREHREELFGGDIVDEKPDSIESSVPA